MRSAVKKGVYKRAAVCYNICMEYTLITGATGVLGREFSLQCLSNGENLYLTGRSDAKLSALRRELLESHPEAEIKIFACDLANEDSLGDLFADAQDLTFSRLINVAGADVQKPFLRYTHKKLTMQSRVNFEAAAAMCLFCLAHRAQKLCIINISSLAGEFVTPYFAVYASSKGALTSFSQALAYECGGTGVTVCAVLPGAVYTRPDVKEYISKQGLWGRIAAKTPKYVAAKALKAANRGKTKYVPGVANKLLYFATKLLPPRLRIAACAAVRKNMQKDAF